MSGNDPFMYKNKPAGRGRGRGGNGRNRGGNFRGGHNNSQQAQARRPRQPQLQDMYGVDPEDLRELQEIQKANEQNRRGRGGFIARRHGRPFHDRPPLVIQGHPERDNKANPSNMASKSGPTQDARLFDDYDDSGEMNAHLSERILAPKRPTDRGTTNRFSALPKNTLVEKLEKPTEAMLKSSGWRARPEVPNAAELMSEEVELPANEISQPWSTTDDYLEAHYELLREDSFSPLRDMVGVFRADPEMDDTHDLCIYENCKIIGITMSHTLGICTKLNFSTNRARKRIRWENSKRLCPGTLVALTTDNFNSVIRIATVAARPLAGVDPDLPNGPEVDLLFQPGELEIDPTQTWIMIESRRSYFEAYKHTLKALQRMDDGFPLSKILTLRDKRIRAPQFLKENPRLDMTPCFNDHADTSRLTDVNIIRDFPSKKNVTTSMDESQLQAVQRIITKELAIIQGPPGCGKTFVSVKALSAMLRNKKIDDPPIVVACQTNHALDQLLRHVIDFEPGVIRLGGRTQDQDKIKERTLYNIRKTADWFEIQGSSFGKCKRALKRLECKAVELLAVISEGCVTPDALHHYGLISEAQRKSWHTITEDWVKLSAGHQEKPMAPMPEWLGDFLVPTIRREDLALEYEDEDIGVEELKDREAEFDDEFDGKLRGYWIEFKRTKEVLSPIGIAEDELDEAMKMSNVWDIHNHLRPRMYMRLEKALIAAIQNDLRKLNKEFADLVAEFKIARWERDAYLLSRANVIGLTTTGVSKYRSLVASLEPKICLIEEAAETLEGPLIAACYPSIQQLILVGDHKQLKGHCNVSELEQAPYHLAISMFERLVNNGVEYTMLTKQRRMRPEIRQILMPIYSELDDDIQVLNKPSVPGMGGVNMYFYAHQVPEESDELSKKNVHEAQMVINFCNYLVENGIKQPEITILTFYTGQLRELFKLLRRHPRLNQGDDRIRVATVDSYQGEENEIVILSLCRSNMSGSIGFLSIPNRVCVALSRAKRGFYMFGNAGLLSQVSSLWWDILQILNNRKPTAISTTIPLSCQRHKHVSDWVDLNGGCTSKCGELLACGHQCTLRCHPYDHALVACVDTCRKVLECGHRCRKECRDKCKCDRCPQGRTKPPIYAYENAQADKLPAYAYEAAQIDPVPAYAYENAQMSKLSERLAEVKTTDMTPAMLNPVSPKKTTPKKTPLPSGKAGGGENNPPIPAMKPPKQPDHIHKHALWDGGRSTPSNSNHPTQSSKPPSKPASKGGDAEQLLISFDDEPATKTSTFPGNGVVSFDMNKVLIPDRSGPSSPENDVEDAMMEDDAENEDGSDNDDKESDAENENENDDDDENADDDDADNADDADPAASQQLQRERERESSSDAAAAAAAAAADARWRPRVSHSTLTAKTYDIIPYVAAPMSTSIHAFCATPCMRWIFTGGQDGYIRKFDWYASINGKVPLTVAQKHPFVDSVTRAGVLLSYWENEEIPDKNSLFVENDEMKISPVYSLATHSQALWLLSGLESGNINLQSVRHDEGKIITVLRKHKSAVSVLALGADEKSLISGSWDKDLLDWDLNKGEVVRTYAPQAGQLSALQWRPQSIIPIPVERQPIMNGITTSSLSRLANGFANGNKSPKQEVDVDAPGSPASSGGFDSLFGGDDDDLFGAELSNGRTAQNSTLTLDGDDDVLMGDAHPQPAEQQLINENASSAAAAAAAIAADTGNSSSNTTDHTASSDTVGDTNLDIPDTRDAHAEHPHSPSAHHGALDGSTDVSSNVFLAASIDGIVRIFDRRQEKPITRLLPGKGIPPWSTSACWGVDGNHVYVGRRNVCASFDNLRLYDLKDEEAAKHSRVPFLIVPGHHGGVLSSVFVDPTCTYLLTMAGNRGWEGTSTEVMLGYEIVPVV
ncbi:hypothetical protein Dda_7348 [Drechslerella dactyloides]|uniref:Uncharacterized protein n=1 Tax=Drechslerella dactyloides TaxID=74499 RepID=A0AAD6IS77_DREDA|nr:hypothetical protein Dda_7348 [Drechslerella dactyloides]